MGAGIFALCVVAVCVAERDSAARAPQTASGSQHDTHRRLRARESPACLAVGAVGHVRGYRAGASIPAPSPHSCHSKRHKYPRGHAYRPRRDPPLGPCVPPAQRDVLHTAHIPGLCVPPTRECSARSAARVSSTHTALGAAHRGQLTPHRHTSPIYSTFHRGQPTPTPVQVLHTPGAVTPAPAQVHLQRCKHANSMCAAMQKSGLAPALGPITFAGSLENPSPGSNSRPMQPANPEPEAKPLGHRANACSIPTNARTYWAGAALLVAVRPSPRPCTACRDSAPAPAAPPRPQPTLLPWRGCRRHSRVARCRPDLQSASAYRSCQRSFQPTSRRRPPRTSARWPRGPMRIG